MKRIYIGVLLACFCSGLFAACAQEAESAAVEQASSVRETVAEPVEAEEVPEQKEAPEPEEEPAEPVFDEPEIPEPEGPLTGINRDTTLHRQLAAEPAGERYLFLSHWDGTETVLFYEQEAMLAVADALSVPYPEGNLSWTPSDDFAVYVVEDGFLVYRDAYYNWGLMEENAKAHLGQARSKGTPADFTWVTVEDLGRFDEVFTALREEQGLTVYYPGKDRGSLHDSLEIGYTYDNSAGLYNGYTADYDIGEFPADDVFAFMLGRLAEEGLLVGTEMARVNQYNGAGTSFTRSVEIYVGERLDGRTLREMEKLWRQHLAGIGGYDEDGYRWSYNQKDAFSLAVLREGGFSQAEGEELEALYGITLQER